MARCLVQRCTGKIKFNKPAERSAPKGKCTVCGQKYIAAYNCDAKLRIIKID
jgi:hypothetical protein